MPAVGGAGVPSLSQIRQWDTEHLEAASRSWSAIGETWEDSFNSSYRGVAQPAGTSWEGEAAEAATARSYEDLIKVRGLADTLHEAASVARSGAGELEYAKRRVLYAVQDAEAAGFTVGEDLSLTSRETFTSGAAMAAKQLQAETLAAEIRTRAAALSALDVEVAGKITTAMAPLGAVDFAETPPGEGDRDGSVQAVDHRTFKEGPDLSPTPEPDGAGGGEGEGGPQPLPRHPNYPNRTTDGKYGEGNSRDGKWEEKVALDKYEEATGVPVIRDQVRATHPDVQNPGTGKPQGRFYDGLQPTGNPGEYIGIEAKSDGVSVPGDQARFDAAVTPENPATAILNGEEIKIVGTDVVYPQLESGPAPPAVPQPPQGGAPTSLPAPVEGSAGVPDVPTTSTTGGGGGSWGGETSWPDMMSMPHEQLVKLAESGDPLGNIAKMILQSPEYQARHPPPTAWALRRLGRHTTKVDEPAVGGIALDGSQYVAGRNVTCLVIRNEQLSRFVGVEHFGLAPHLRGRRKHNRHIDGHRTLLRTANDVSHPVRTPVRTAGFTDLYRHGLCASGRLQILQCRLSGDIRIILARGQRMKGDVPTVSAVELAQRPEELQRAGATVLRGHHAAAVFHNVGGNAHVNHPNESSADVPHRW